MTRPRKSTCLGDGVCTNPNCPRHGLKGTSDSCELAGFAPMPTLRAFIGTVLESHRDTRGDTKVYIQIAEWGGCIALSELYGLWDRLLATDVQP